MVGVLATSLSCTEDNSTSVRVQESLNCYLVRMASRSNLNLNTYDLEVNPRSVNEANSTEGEASYFVSLT